MDILDDDKHPLENFFKDWEGKSGVYFLSPYYDPNHPQEKYPVKVGMSRHSTEEFDRTDVYGGLGRRMDSYLLCYPKGFYIYAVIECDRKDAYTVEKTFHEYFTTKKYQVDDFHSHREEWFVLDFVTIVQTIIGVNNDEGKPVLTHIEYFDPPTLVNTNGRLAKRTKHELSTPVKKKFESCMEPDCIPATAKKTRTL
jgi:hypothetical protein